MLRSSIHELSRLGDDECFKVFSHHAFHGEPLSSFSELGREISNKCKGSPLAAKALGSLLRNEADIGEWKAVRESKSIWPSGDDKDPVMQVLRFSYQYLPSHLKKCFRYLSVFPKDFQIEKNELIGMWIAHGYVSERGSRRKELEDIGEKYWNELVSRSLLKKFLPSYFEDPECVTVCTMHVLTHDLAHDVSRDDNPSVVRSLLDCHARPGILDVCCGMKQLRVLDLANAGVKGIPPENIGDLIHVRYISFEGNPITGLPESMGKLHHVKTLIVNDTFIKVFPDVICSMKQLRYLGLRRTDIKYLPESLGTLNRLYTLDVLNDYIQYLPESVWKLPSLRRLIVSDGVVFPAWTRKLSNLRCACGQHRIVQEFVGMVDEQKAKAEATGMGKIMLLSLIWNDDRLSNKHRKVSECILESLLPFSLNQLYVEGFGGHSLPLLTRLKWLRRIHLVRCEHLTSLPSLEDLRYLTHVYIDSANHLQGTFSFNEFKYLEALEITNCPQLQRLEVKFCRALRYLSICCLHGLEAIDLEDCHSRLDFWVQSCPNLKYFMMLGLKTLKDICVDYSGDLGAQEENCVNKLSKMDCLSIDRLFLLEKPSIAQNMTIDAWWMLQTLSIVSCTSLEKFPMSSLLSIKDIYVKDCPNLLIPWPEIVKLLGIEKLLLVCIRGVELISCGYETQPEGQRFDHKFQPFSRLWNLGIRENLIISRCDFLECLSFEELPSALKAIQIHGCNSLTKILSGSQHRLQYLSIKDCSVLSRVECTSSYLIFLEIYPPQEGLVFCAHGTLCCVEYLSIGNCTLEVSYSHPLLPAMKVMEIDGTTPEILVCLKENHADSCYRLTSLPPPIKILEILEELRVVNFLGGAFMREQWTLSALRKLEIIECQDLDGFSLCEIQSLEHLRITKCRGPNQDKMWMPSGLKILEFIECCDLAKFSLHRLESLEELRLTRYNGPATFIQEKQMPPKLKRLVLEECYDTTRFPLYVLDALEELKIIGGSGSYASTPDKFLPLSLKRLEIVRCSRLKRFPLYLLEGLEELSIIDSYGPAAVRKDEGWLPSTLCVLIFDKLYGEAFLRLNCLNSLKRLYLKHAEYLKFPAEDFDLPQTMEELCIIKCPYLEKWCDENRRKLAHIRLLEEEEDKHHEHIISFLLSANESTNSDIPSTEDDEDFESETADEYPS